MQTVHCSLNFKIFILMSILLFSCVNDNDFITKGKVEKGYVYDVESGNKGLWSIKYEYFIDSIRYTGSCTSPGLPSSIHKYQYKYFPIIYLKDDPNKSRILMSRYDFESVHLAFPDSLSWVIEK